MVHPQPQDSFPVCDNRFGGNEGRRTVHETRVPIDRPAGPVDLPVDCLFDSKTTLRIIGGSTLDFPILERRRILRFRNRQLKFTQDKIPV